MATAPLTIYTYPGNARVQRAQIAALYNEVEIKVPAFEMGKTNKTPEFLAKFPLGKVPAMDTPFGPLTETNAIYKYVLGLRTDTGLLGANYYERALVEQWLEHDAHELAPHRLQWWAQDAGYFPYNAETLEGAKQGVYKFLAYLDKHLADKTYIVGNKITAADIAIATSLVSLFSTYISPAKRAEVANVMRWFDLCVNQPHFKTVIGEVKFATAEKQIGPKA